MLPYYLLMRLPDDENQSFILMQPFTPRNRPNMVSFLVAKSDPGEYGEIVDYTFPTDTAQPGPGQVGDFINQDTEISAQFTLLGQGGSEVIQGNMLVVPVEESVIYVQPVYLQGTAQNALPELKRVVVVFEDRIIMRTTLAEAIDAVFGTDTSGPDNIGPGCQTHRPGGSGIVDQPVRLGLFQHKLPEKKGHGQHHLGCRQLNQHDKAGHPLRDDEQLER